MMNHLKFLEGLAPVQMRLIDICRAMSENEKVLVGAKEILKVLAIEDWQMDESDFEHDCEALGVQVDPIDAYPPLSVGYAYRLLLEMGMPWRCRYPYFELRGMIGDQHDDLPQGPEYVEARLSPFSHVVMPVGRAPLLPISLLNGVVLPDGTEIPSHNLEELWTAFEHLRQDPAMPLDNLMEFIPGPDFASGGVVGGAEAIRSLYADGKGALTLRGDIKTEIEGARTRVAITSLPPGVLVRDVMEQIRALAREGKVSFYNIKDASHRERIRIVLDTPRNLSSPALQEILFRETDLEKRVNFQCAFSDETGWTGANSLIETLREATVRCTLSWQRKDGEPIEYLPLLREIQEYGGYISRLTDLIDMRRSRLLNLAGGKE